MLRTKRKKVNLIIATMLSLGMTVIPYNTFAYAETTNSVEVTEINTEDNETDNSSNENINAENIDTKENVEDTNTEENTENNSDNDINEEVENNSNEATEYNTVSVNDFSTSELSEDMLKENKAVTSNAGSLDSNGLTNTATVKLGNSYAVGDVIPFSIATVLPSYSEAYENPTFSIIDTMDAGLDHIEEKDLLITDNEGNIIEQQTSDKQDNYTLELTENDDGTQVIKITFLPKYLFTLNTSKNIVIKYSTKLNSDALMAGNSTDETAFLDNLNKVQLSYSNNPNNPESQYTETVAVTHQYTYNLVDEIQKIKEENDQPLEGATFVLTKLYEEDGSDVTEAYIYESISNKDGFLTYKGLNTGVYELEETVSPMGYSLNRTIYTIDISNTFKDDGVLESYTIDIYDNKTHPYKDSNGELTHNPIVSKTYTKGNDASSYTEPLIQIIDSQLQNMPTTGGSGIYLILTVGAIGMAGVGILVYRFIKKAKSIKES